MYVCICLFVIYYSCCCCYLFYFILFHYYYFFIYRQSVYSLRSRRLEVVGERENGCARGRHARGEGAPARKAPENRFNSHSVSADISNWSRGSRGKN